MSERSTAAPGTFPDRPTTTVSCRKPRIVLVGHLAGDVIFGAERSLLGILAAIDPERFDVSCVLPNDSDLYRQAVAKHARSITVFPYQWWSKSRPTDQEIVSRFESIFRRESVDLIHVNTITLMDPLVAARHLGVPSIVHARELIDEDNELTEHFGEEASEVVRRICSASDFIIANSDATHRMYRKAERSFRLYNSVDAECFDLPIKLEPGKLRVGLISSNLPKKGIRAFVHLAVMASRCQSELEFFVIGPRNEHVDALRQTVLGEARPVNIHFVGYVSNPVEALQHVDVVLCLSTVAESFGRTIAEALAAGRLVIAYKRGATPELIRHGTDGYLIPYLNYARALEHLAMLVAHPEKVLEMGRNGRERAKRLFSPAVFAVQLNIIYRQILDFWKARKPDRD